MQNREAKIGKKRKERNKTMATQIRAIPTLYGDTASDFERQAAMTEQNPGTEDYRHEAEIVAEYLKTLDAVL